MRLVDTLQGPFWVWDQDHLGQVLESRAWWDQQLRPFLDAVADPTALAIDLGANVGWFTVYLAGLFKWVIAVEANHGTYDLLVRNLNQWQLGNVNAILAAAYDDEDGVLVPAPADMLGWPVPEDLNQTPNASSIAFVPAPNRADGPSKLKLDTLVPSNAAIPRVAVIKCDVQGCDLRALKGGRQVLLRDRPRVLFEYEGGIALAHGDTWADYERFFEEIDYRVTRVREDIWDYVADPLEGVRCPA